MVVFDYCCLSHCAFVESYLEVILPTCPPVAQAALGEASYLAVRRINKDKFGWNPALEHLLFIYFGSGD
jgi:hypothetical protein